MCKIIALLLLIFTNICTVDAILDLGNILESFKECNVQLEFVVGVRDNMTVIKHFDRDILQSFVPIAVSVNHYKVNILQSDNKCSCGNNFKDRKDVLDGFESTRIPGTTYLSAASNRRENTRQTCGVFLLLQDPHICENILPKQPTFGFNVTISTYLHKSILVYLELTRRQSQCARYAVLYMEHWFGEIGFTRSGFLNLDTATIVESQVLSQGYSSPMYLTMKLEPELTFDAENSVTSTLTPTVGKLITCSNIETIISEVVRVCAKPTFFLFGLTEFSDCTEEIVHKHSYITQTVNLKEPISRKSLIELRDRSCSHQPTHPTGFPNVVGEGKRANIENDRHLMKYMQFLLEKGLPALIISTLFPNTNTTSLSKKSFTGNEYQDLILTVSVLFTGPHLEKKFEASPTSLSSFTLKNLEIHFVTCSPKETLGALSYTGYISAYQTEVWLGLLGSLICGVIIETGGHSLLTFRIYDLFMKLSSTAYKTYKILLAQNAGNFNKKRWFWSGWLIGGIFFTYLYLGDNIDRLVAPIPVWKLDTFENLLKENVTVYSPYIKRLGYMIQGERLQAFSKLLSTVLIKPLLNIYQDIVGNLDVKPVYVTSTEQAPRTKFSILFEKYYKHPSLTQAEVRRKAFKYLEPPAIGSDFERNFEAHEYHFQKVN